MSMINHAQKVMANIVGESLTLDQEYIIMANSHNYSMPNLGNPKVNWCQLFIVIIAIAAVIFCQYICAPVTEGEKCGYFMLPNERKYSYTTSMQHSSEGIQLQARCDLMNYLVGHSCDVTTLSETIMHCINIQYSQFFTFKF